MAHRMDALTQNPIHHARQRLPTRSQSRSFHAQIRRVGHFAPRRVKAVRSSAEQFTFRLERLVAGGSKPASKRQQLFAFGRVSDARG
jgi:ATP phosphoribosyltransferase regulatory subunit HisZ